MEWSKEECKEQSMLWLQFWYSAWVEAGMPNLTKLSLSDEQSRRNKLTGKSSKQTNE